MCKDTGDHTLYLVVVFKDSHKKVYDNYTERYRKCSVFDIFKSTANLPVFQYIGKNKGNGAL